MTRSKLRKIRRLEAKRSRPLLQGLPLAGALLASAGVAHAQQAEQENAGLDEVVVTALKTSRTCRMCRYPSWRSAPRGSRSWASMVSTTT
jgi:hypothetical protein